MPTMSAGPRSFFTPRLAHHRPEYELIPATPGSPVADWRNPEPSRWTKRRQKLLPKYRQHRPSPAGLSKLPYELLEPIFASLTGRELASVRLVCTGWELASRAFFQARSIFAPFFAERHPPECHIIVPLSADAGPWRRGVPPERCLFVRPRLPSPASESKERPDYGDRYRGRPMAHATYGSLRDGDHDFRRLPRRL